MVDKKLLLVSIFSLVYALFIFINKLALNANIKPFNFVIQTTLVSVSLLSAYAIVAKKREIKKIDTQVRVKLMLIGLFTSSAFVIGNYGLRLSSSINYSFLIKSSLIFSILLAFILLKENLGKAKIFLMLVFIIGVYLVTTGGEIIIPRIGDLLIIIAAFTLSCATIVQKQLSNKVDPYIIGWGNRLSGLLFLFFVALIFKINFYEIIAPRIILTAGFLSAGVVVYLNKTIAVSSVSYATMMSMVVPVLNLVLGLIFLNETMGTVQLLGGVLIILSGIFVHKLKI